MTGAGSDGGVNAEDNVDHLLDVSVVPNGVLDLYFRMDRLRHDQ